MPRTKAAVRQKPAGRKKGRTARTARRRSSTKPASRRPAAARGKRRHKPAAKAPPRKQTFVASHHSPDAFEIGLRRYAQYRDLGIAAATNGLARAHVIKMVPPCDPAEVSKRHYHDVEFQMVYVLKGWIKGEYDGAGIVTMREGSCWLQPPKIEHAVLDYSDDCELLEIILPADFDTVELE
jgi:mannose-6-phosphate isomerase-like protein (cupin superfamily)